MIDPTSQQRKNQAENFFIRSKWVYSTRRPPPCKKENCAKASSFQVGIFYCALYVTALGSGGTKPTISIIGADQFDEFDPKEKTHKHSYFNWWMFSAVFGVLFSSTFLVYIQDNVGFALGYGLPTAGLVISVLVFLVGTPFYRHKVRSGSPLTRMAQVLVAAARKWKLPLPNDPKDLHELSLEEYTNNCKLRIGHTPLLRFRDKAAVKSVQNTPWTLYPVTQVEETKQMIKMIPILVPTFIPNATLAQLHTLFVKPGTTLDRNLGPHFEIPPASLYSFVTIFMLIGLFDRFFVPAIRRYTKSARGITLLKRMGIGFVLHIMAMITACLVERRRLSTARENGIFGINETLPLTIFILLPPFAVMGIAEAFMEVAVLEFFYDQAPESMKSLGTSYYSSSRGVGNFLSSFLVTTVSDITKRHGHKGWILNNLNLSRLDYFYAFLAVLSVLNFLFFVLVSKLFVYNADTEKMDKMDKMDLPMETLPNEAP